jgi:cell wall-associated NlpC family hydrolase
MNCQVENRPFFSTTETQARLVAVARSWVGTPFFSNAAVKGHGVSCQMLVAEIYRECGVVPPDFSVPTGRTDWARANKRSVMEPFIDGLPQFTSADRPAQAGDLLGFALGGCVHHLGVCIGTHFVHAIQDRGVSLCRMDDASYMQRLSRVWRPLLCQSGE